jgi:uncharacterized protein
MRRSEKALHEADAIGSILRDAPYLTLAIPDGKESCGTYPVPLSFGIEGRWENQETPLDLWIHSAKQGRKWELFTQLSDKEVSLAFTAVAAVQLKDGGEKACSYSAYFRSVIGSGKLTIVEDPEEKRRGLEFIMAHYSPEKRFSFPEETLQKTGVIRLRVNTITGKQNPPEQK